MNLHVVITQVGGYAREDAPQPSVVGAYLQPELATTVARIVGSQAHVQTVVIDQVPAGLHRTAQELGVKLPAPLVDADAQMPRQAYAQLFRELAPNCVAWRTMSRSYTGEEMARLIEQRQPEGLQFVSELLRVSRDLLRRDLERKPSS